MLGRRQSVALFVDGSNFFATLDALGMRNIDYNKIRAFFGKKETLFRSYYFTAINTPPEGVEDKFRPILDFLKFHNWMLVTKPAKTFYDHASGQSKIKGNMDSEITTEMLLLKDQVQHMVLFSGDGDFAYPVSKLQSFGVQVTVVSSRKTRPPMMSGDLASVCNKFIDIADMREHFIYERKTSNA